MGLFQSRDNKKSQFYCCQICKENNITVQYAHNSSTGNMLGHLWSKHRIDKDYPEKTNTNGSIIKVMHVITKWRQEKITQLLVEFIIEDCQPFHILQSKAFCCFLNYMEAGFQIPCEQTVKKIINKAYEWSHDQLFSMINMDEKCRYLKIHQTIDDVPTRWNSSYLAWIWLKELRKVIEYLGLMLSSELEPTNIFSGSSYPTHNLKLLINKFAPSNEQTEEDYVDLLFESSSRHVKENFY
ncbi:3068_t:CDS:2 [Dentiscutata erythropus]|uniref:3068_t:CDS:1 n=1 Tax=Dentiscutata erythropus TaxID=1348616 RepID=A0A9N9DZT3_9GLOM|nr:3068_t:CDS:2 [Dentiscutata erythropus]